MLCTPGAQPSGRIRLRTGRGDATKLLWEFQGGVIFGLKLEFYRKRRKGVYPRDLEAVKMVVFTGKRAACREGQTRVVKDT